jgi:hypothetical protein
MKARIVFGVAVQQGKFRADRIAYDERGKSTVTPITGWVTAAEAFAAKRKAEEGRA